ncbi:hypothetical protein WA158_003743 [Blastocystis sp. Blastoise]
MKPYIRIRIRTVLIAVGGFLVLSMLISIFNIKISKGSLTFYNELNPNRFSQIFQFINNNGSTLRTDIELYAWSKQEPNDTTSIAKMNYYYNNLKKEVEALEEKAKKYQDIIDFYYDQQNYYQVEDAYKSGYKTLDSRVKKGQGVLLFAYSSDITSADRFFDQAFTTAVHMISVDKLITVCIMVSHPRDIIPPDRIKIIVIPPHHLFHGVSDSFYQTSNRQFRTRLLYYGFTPFQTTLALDASSTFCLPNAATLILDYFKSSGVDFSCTTRTVDKLFCSGHAILFNWNPRTKHFFRNLFYASLDDRRMGDDQLALKRILPKALATNTLKFRWFANSKLFSANFYSVQGKSDEGRAFRISTPLNGPIYIMHESPSFCPFLNQEEEVNKFRFFCLKKLPMDNDLANEYLKQNRTPFNTYQFAHNMKELRDCLYPYTTPDFIFPVDQARNVSFFI